MFVVCASCLGVFLSVIHEEHIAESFYVPLETGWTAYMVAADAITATHISSTLLQMRLELFKV